jgi:hypothetical protein
MLTTAQLNQMRTDANRLLPDDATIYRRTMTEDSTGSETPDWSTKIGEVKCRLSAQSVKSRARDIVRGGKIEAAEPWMVSLPIGTDLEVTDRLEIVCQSRPDLTSTYEVVSSAEPRSYDVNLRVIVKKV